MAATTSFSNWNFYNQRVQQELDGGAFVSAETTLIAAGPANLSGITSANTAGTPVTQADTGDFEAYPIGLLESFGLQQNKQLQRIFEIGSSRSYFIPGRVIGSIALGRTFYHGPNLLRVLYAYYDQGGSTQYNSETPNGEKLVSGGKKFNPARIPGYDKDHFYIDLASSMFSQPTGMAVYFKAYDNTTVGAFYLDNCYVQGHQLNVSSGSVLVMEGAQLQYDMLTPIQATT